MRNRFAALAGSGLFLVIAPGAVAFYLPWLIGRWRFRDVFGDSLWSRGLGIALVLFGGLVLLECFIRFAWTGLGTPAPVAPTRHLVVSGLYRYVRNPMYVAVASLILGQAMLFGDPRLLIYAAAIWAGFHAFVLAYEEPTLRRRFPEDYARYVRAVPRWIPRLRPWRGE